MPLTASKTFIEDFAKSNPNDGADKLARRLVQGYAGSTQGRSFYSVLSVIRRYRASRAKDRTFTGATA